MPRKATLLILFIAALMVGAYDPPPETGEDVARARVIVRANRNREVPGYLELQDEDVVVVRKLDGQLESFTKTRILGVIHLVDPLPDQRGVVYLRNGQVSAGVVLRDDFDVVVVKVQGIPVEFGREHVDYVVLAPTFEQKYAQFKSGMRPEMLERHLELCRWLVAQKRYVLARKELSEVMQMHPGSADARNLTRLVQAQLDMKSGVLKPRDNRAPSNLPPPNDPNRGPVRPSDMLPEVILTHDDVNIIRVFEIDLSRPPQVAISPDTIRTLLEEYGSSKLIPRGADQRNALFRADPVAIVRLMFALRARELYPEIDVLSEPYALNVFRRRVHNTWLMNGCSTSRCHGGPFAGRFFLHRKGHKDPRVRLTNLLNLERTELDPAWPLINYTSPMDSLIIQYALPRHLARKPHPDVRGWTPVFSKTNTRMLDQTIDWISSMMQPRPDYPVEYEPPRFGEPEAVEEDPGVFGGEVPSQAERTGR